MNKYVEESASVEQRAALWTQRRPGRPEESATRTAHSLAELCGY